MSLRDTTCKCAVVTKQSIHSHLVEIALSGTWVQDCSASLPGVSPIYITSNGTETTVRKDSISGNGITVVE